MINLVAYQSSFLMPFMEWRGQASSVRHNPLRNMNAAEIETMLESEGADLSDLKRYQAYRWFIEYDGAIVGSVSLKEINHMMKYAEIGYGVAEAYQGKGIATTAVRLVVDRVFDRTDLRKIIALVHDKNQASCRVLKKAGFKQEGLLREHFIINGVPENEIFFGLLRQEWIAR